jgi:hypothetical protein
MYLTDEYNNRGGGGGRYDRQRKTSVTKVNIFLVVL